MHNILSINKTLKPDRIHVIPMRINKHQREKQPSKASSRFFLTGLQTTFQKPEKQYYSTGSTFIVIEVVEILYFTCIQLSVLSICESLCPEGRQQKQSSDTQGTRVVNSLFLVTLCRLLKRSLKTTSQKTLTRTTIFQEVPWFKWVFPLGEHSAHISDSTS